MNPDFSANSTNTSMLHSTPPTNTLQMEEHPKQLPQPAPSSTQPSLADYDQFVRKFHQHTLSESTNTTGSNDSSPTTTISTVDDSSATEPSPGSSPESPPPSTFAAGMLRPRTADDRSAPFFELQKQPPPRKGRNLKNLAVNTSRPGLRASSTTSLPLQVRTDGPSILSPSFVKPPTPPRRRPSNLALTLLTPAGGKSPPQEVKLAIPPTPGFARPGTLRHFQSSPSLPLLSGFNMAHTHIAEVSEHPPLETIQSPVEPPSEPLSIEEEEEQNFDIPLSQEVKPEAYPDGPICVYEPHIDLYLEPTAEQVRQYDVILNVASEVRNPLLRSDDPAPVEPEMRLDGGGGIQFKPRADRDHLVIPKQDPHENLSEDVCNSPSTPKAPQTIAHGPKTEGASKDPEYIHIKWEHNSDIVPDLLNLCKLIDDRVAQGKRVLIHCQCGVSRSASLVVAYGLYKSPTMSVQEAYDSVKRRSKWIGPNMNLIMQLQEFRSSLARGGLLTSRTTMSPLTPASALSEWSGPFTGTSSTGMLELPSVNPGGGVSPGPSSAPSGVPWPISDKLVTQRKTSVGAMKPAGPFVDTSGHVLSGLPVVEVVAPDKRASEPVGRTNSHATTPKAEVEPEPVSSPRSTEFAMAPLQPPKDVDPADAFGILSPTSTEFTINPFDRSSLLASLGMGSMQDDEAPTRQRASLRTRQCPQQQSTQETRITEPHPRKLRGKISSPSIREERELRSLQAKIEANLLLRNRSFTPPDEGDANAEALLSPRATEFTSNPFTFSTIPPASVAEPSEDPRSPIVDPRSPAQKGANPITRNILDVL